MIILEIVACSGDKLFHAFSQHAQLESERTFMSAIAPMCFV